MHAKLYTFEQDLERYKKLMDISVMIDVIAELLISKGIMTADEIASAISKVKASEQEGFDINEAETDLEVFRFMMREGVKEEARLNGFLNEDGTWKKD